MFYKMLRLVVVAIISALLCSSCSRAVCPPGCECSEAAQTVKCVSKDLRTIPTGIPGYTRNLFITGNQIIRIGPDSFKGVQNVTNLSLSNNRITEVEPQTFSALRSLRSLDLSNNQLALVHPDSFSVEGGLLRELNLSRALYNHSSVADLASALRWGGLSGLLGLDLSGNLLVLLPPGMFAHLSSLRRLLLANNSLVALHNGTFSGLGGLEELDLTLNALKTVREEGLRELDGLPRAHLLLGENPYTCTCGIEDFARWLNGSWARVSDLEQVVCAFPVELRNTTLLGLAGQELGCHGDAAGEGADLALQTSYVFLGVVLGFVGVVFLFVLYLNRKGIKKWIMDTRDACRDVLEGYHYRYEIDSDPRMGQISTSGDL